MKDLARKVQTSITLPFSDVVIGDIFMKTHTKGDKSNESGKPRNPGILYTCKQESRVLVRVKICLSVDKRPNHMKRLSKIPTYMWSRAKRHKCLSSSRAQLHCPVAPPSGESVYLQKKV